MIIVELKGGLGNQMLQYAAGKSLAVYHNTFLKMDLSYLQEGYAKENVSKRDYELGIFNISEGFATKKDLAYYKEAPKTIFEKIERKLVKHEFLYESGFPYQDIFSNSSKNCYLNGFWFSERYFKAIESVLRKNFVFKSTPEPRNKMLMEEMQKSNSVSLHVRRGDYVTNPETQIFHGSCTPEYYEKAIRMIKEKVSRPSFFIFSDDIAWVKENMPIEGKTTYIDHNHGPQSFEDMRLMSNCKHHIIANSSFSWWGAWLNPGQQKIVIAPKKWFNKEDINTDDIIPQNWWKI